MAKKKSGITVAKPLTDKQKLKEQGDQILRLERRAKNLQVALAAVLFRDRPMKDLSSLMHEAYLISLV